MSRLPLLNLIFIQLLFIGCGGKDGTTNIDQESRTPDSEWVEDNATDEDASTIPKVAPFPQSGAAIVPAEPDPVVAQIETIYRPDDTRMQPDEYKLKELGINKYESKRLILFSDIDPDIAKTLPPVIDRAYESLVAYFGPPLPARSGADFQITGYLIKDRDRFVTAGLVPVNLPFFSHGQHRGQEFWMYEQEYDYYRRHLLIHEVTHCFMLIEPGLHPPMWYLEGMAELFATHRTLEDKIEFAVMPEDSKAYIGLSRIEMIQKEIAAGRMLNIDQVTNLGPAEFAASRSIPYAWSWAICKFLDRHPRYQSRFRELGQHLVGREFFRLAETLFEPDKSLLAAEWDQFARGIEYGWEFEANAFEIAGNDPVAFTDSLSIDVTASRSWQSSGRIVEAGVPYTITASRTVTLANAPKPWVSEPQGISIRYANGRPIGRLLVGVLVGDRNQKELIETPFEVHDCGNGDVIRFANRGQLMFSVNDFGSERSDNRGAYQVKVIPPTP